MVVLEDNLYVERLLCRLYGFVFGMGAAFGLMLAVSFPQCVLAIIPLIVGRSMASMYSWEGGERIGTHHQYRLWSLKCQWWLCLTLELMQVALLPQEHSSRKGSSYVCAPPNSGALPVWVGSGFFWHATSLVVCTYPSPFRLYPHHQSPFAF